MSGETLRVDPEVLRTATTVFGETVDALKRMRADVAIGDAATAVGQLRTAESCRNAQQGMAAAVTAAVESVREYGESLDAAVRAYAGDDQAGANAIQDVDIPT